MTEKPDDDAASRHCGVEPHRWRFSRLELRPRAVTPSDVSARVELIHPERGLVSDITAADTDIDAVFAAVSYITGFRGRLTGLTIIHDRAPVAEIAPPQVSASISLQLAGISFPGTAIANGLMPAIVSAFLDAIHRSELSARGMDIIVRGSEGI